MSLFLGGPAAGKEIRTSRAPVLLRVVVGPGEDGAIDVLDRLEDKARPGEGVHLYRRKPGTDTSSGFWAGRNKKGGRIGGTFVNATYEYWKDQPAQEILSDNELWDEWCADRENREAVLKGTNFKVSEK